MRWIRLYTESDENQTIPISVSTRELKLIQNYMNHGKPLNDPSNRECMETVLRILQDLINNSTIENLDIKISNYLFENFGVELDIDPYGKNTSIPLSGNGLIEIKDCKNKMLSRNGEYADLIEGGFWDDETGELTNGFISVVSIHAPARGATSLMLRVRSSQLKTSLTQPSQCWGMYMESSQAAMCWTVRQWVQQHR